MKGGGYLVVIVAGTIVLVVIAMSLAVAFVAARLRSANRTLTAILADCDQVERGRAEPAPTRRGSTDVR